MAPSGHIPFCPKVKAMPGFDWLKIKEGKTSLNPPNSRNSPILSVLFHKKRMHDICMLLDARMILEWALYSVNLLAAKRLKIRVGAHLGPMLEILMDNLP